MEKDNLSNSKSTLKNSLDLINANKYEMEELVQLSNTLLNKFINPHSELDDLKGLQMEERLRIKNIIELFDSATNDIKHSISDVKNNLEKVLDMIG